MRQEGLDPEFRNERTVRITIDLGREVDEEAKTEVLSWFSEMRAEGNVSCGDREIVLEVNGDAVEIAIISGMAVSVQGLHGVSCEVIASSIL